MVRFILVCMAVVLTTIIATSAQFVVDGIDSARNAVIARNNPQPQDVELAKTQASGPSFEEIYANAPVISTDNMSAEQLNAMETAAGGNDFGSDAFTNIAPAGLEDVPAPAPVQMNEIVVQEGEIN